MNSTRRQFVQTGLLLGASAIVRAAPVDLKIGLTPVILADQAAFLTRWAAYLAESAGATVTFVARTEYQLVLDMLLQRQIHVAWLCGYPYIQHQSRLSLLAVPLYQGTPTYQAYLIRPQGSPLTGWLDLRDKVLAYADRLSNSGWLVAQAQLREAGVAPRELKRTFFAYGHKRVAESVASQLADAGAIDGYVWDTMRKQRMQAALDTELVWRSRAFGFPPLVSLHDTTHPLVEPLQQTLLSMSKDSAGQALLQDLNLDGFVAGDSSMYDSIRQTARIVDDAELSG
jgi:phosphonate transport system substrate-binding protein